LIFASAAHEKGLRHVIGMNAFNITMAPEVPTLNQKRARQVIATVDGILAWETKIEQVRDRKFVELGRALCEIRARQHWRVEDLTSFNEFLEKRFPGSRRKAFYLMSVHEQLPKKLHPQIETLGWSKAIELTRVARKRGSGFDSETWLQRAREMPKERFKQAVEKEIWGKEEVYELVTFKLYEGQLKVVEQALETTSKLLGSDKPRGYCLEMICADFLAGAHQQLGDWAMVIAALRRTYELLPSERQIEFLRSITKPRLLTRIETA
jgi:hypothetical protein